MKKMIALQGSRKRLNRGTNGRRIDLKKLKQRQREQERLDAVMSDEADPELYSEAKRYIERVSNFDQLANAIESGQDLVGKVDMTIKKLSKKEHLIRIMAAYSFWIKSGRHRKYMYLVQKALQKRAKNNPKTTKLHLIIESLIAYEDDVEGKRKYSKLYSRDAQAIRWLNSKGITPQNGIELAQKQGEGLDAWADRWAKTQKQAKADNEALSGKKISRVDADIDIRSPPTDMPTADQKRLMLTATDHTSADMKLSWTDADGEKVDLIIRATPENTATIHECMRRLTGISGIGTRPLAIGGRTLAGSSNNTRK